MNNIDCGFVKRLHRHYTVMTEEATRSFQPLKKWKLVSSRSVRTLLADYGYFTGWKVQKSLIPLRTLPILLSFLFNTNDPFSQKEVISYSSTSMKIIGLVQKRGSVFIKQQTNFIRFIK